MKTQIYAASAVKGLKRVTYCIIKQNKMMVVVIRSLPRKHETLPQRCVDFGPPYTTPVQHQPNIG